jgi:DNA-binding response OmpR family regulator
MTFNPAVAGGDVATLPPGPLVDAARPGAPRARKVAIVDDDPIICEMLSLALMLEGFEVTAVGDGKDALDLFLVDPPDVILLDVMMPNLSGFDVMERLRRDDPNNSTPVILVTAKTSDEDVWEGWSRGAQSYITKPLDMDMLLSEIARVTGTGVGIDA